MHRRDFLKFSGAGIASTVIGGVGLVSWSPRAHAETIYKTFYITHGYATQIDGTDVYFRGFSSNSNVVNVPGESFIVQEGDTVVITVVNRLSTTHNFTIDGLVNVTIRGGETRRFSFAAQRWGTYMYYDSRNAPYNRLVGMHGAMAVMPRGSSNELYPGSPTFSNPRGQIFWVMNDIDPVWHNAISRGQTPSTEYIPRYFTLNGLIARPPGAPGNGDPNLDAMYDYRTALRGSIGDRTMVRILNAGLCQQSVHPHGNHMEWLAENGQRRDDVWEKDCLYLEGDKGSLDCIYPFTIPPDAYPRSLARTGMFPMHLHTEMSQTAAGGYYMFGSLTEIFFE